MTDVGNLFSTWPSLLFGGLIGFVSGWVLKNRDFAREHRGIREQILSLLCRIEESAKKASNSNDVLDLSALCALLRERVYSAECATGLLGTRALNALYDDFSAIDSQIQEAVRQTNRSSTRTLETLLQLGARAAVARYRLRDRRPIKIISNPREAVRRIDYLIFFANAAEVASIAAFIISFYLASFLHWLSFPIIGSFVATFALGMLVLTVWLVRTRSHTFAAKLISERLKNRRVVMRFALALLAYFALGAIAIAAVVWFLLIVCMPAFQVFGNASQQDSLVRVAAFWTACAIAFVILVILSVRYARALREEQRIISMASLDGVCRNSPRSIHFGGKQLCGCSPAECISRRVAL